jgi:hypothetical protein
MYEETGISFVQFVKILEEYHIFFNPPDKSMADRLADISLYLDSVKKIQAKTVDEADKEFIRGEISGIRITLHKLGLKIDRIEGY